MNTNDASAARDGPVAGERVQHGTGVNSNRAFPTSAHPQNLDPFVLFERFYIDPDQGFPMHPHRGFEIVSYMVDGGMAHEDSLGVTNTAREGDAMRITTGEGIRHSEFPAGDRGCNGLQLWVNLPRDEKEIEPDYTDASADDLPTEELDGATVTTVVGEDAPLSLRTPMEYLDVTVHDEWEWTPPADWSGFLYGVDGEGEVGGESEVNGDRFSEGDVFTLTEGRAVDVRSESGLRLVAVSGRPHDEPIQQRGPFVL